MPDKDATGADHSSDEADLLAALAASRREVERLSAALEKETAALLIEIAESVALKAENERLREALRSMALVDEPLYDEHGQMVNEIGRRCAVCNDSWLPYLGQAECHAPGCLAALSAQGQQEPTGDSSGG